MAQGIDKDEGPAAERPKRGLGRLYVVSLVLVSASVSLWWASTAWISRDGVLDAAPTPENWEVARESASPEAAPATTSPASPAQAPADIGSVCASACRKARFVNGLGYPPLLYEATDMEEQWGMLSYRMFRDLADQVIRWRKWPKSCDPFDLGRPAPDWVAAACLSPAPVVYSNTPELYTGVPNFTGHMRRPFVLISGNSDLELWENRLARVMENPLVKVWFAHNMKADATRVAERYGGRLRWIPLGVHATSSSDGLHNIQGLVRVHREVRALKHDLSLRSHGGNISAAGHAEWSGRPGVLFACFSFWSHGHGVMRKPLYDRLCDNETLRSWITCCNKRVGVTEFHRQIAKHRFVLAPPGTQRETFRFYEALYLDAVPVISAADSAEELLHLKKHFPSIVVLESFDELTSAEDLEARGREARRRGAPGGDASRMPALWRSYWFREVEAAREEVIRRERITPPVGNGEDGARYRCWGSHCRTIDPKDLSTKLCKALEPAPFKVWGQDSRLPG